MARVMPDDSYPITGVCIVSAVCPNGYIMVDKCLDNSRMEADLWKDHIFAKKIKRFLCFTRLFPLDNGQLNNVLVDICVNEERDNVLDGYSKILETQDSGEQAIKKKQLSVKLVPRSQAIDAINDIQFLHKQKRPPTGYTVIGDFNGLLMCYSVKPVPKESTAEPAAVQEPAIPYSITPLVQNAQYQGTGNPYSAANGHVTADTVMNRQPSNKVHPLTGVPFEVNPIFSSLQNTGNELTGIKLKSKHEVLNEFDYPFRVEHQAQQTSSCYSGM